jgi:ATP-dependent DNA ligase
MWHLFIKAQMRRFQPGIVVNEHFEGDGAIIFKHACALGCEGMYRSASARYTAPADRALAQDQEPGRAGRAGA